MDCFEVKEKLFAYLDGEMQDDVETIEAHFKYCIDCYKRATLERAFVKVIRARASGKPVPLTLEQRIREEISSRSGSSSWTSSQKSSLFLLAAAALLVTALGFTAFGGSSLEPAGPNPAPGAATASLPPAPRVSASVATQVPPAVPAQESRLVSTPIARALLQPSPGHGASAVPAAGSLDGRLICIHCAMGGEGARTDPHEHCNGIQTRDGKIWHILETDLTTDLMHDHTMNGTSLHVDGLISAPAQTVVVSRYHR